MHFVLLFEFGCFFEADKLQLESLLRATARVARDTTTPRAAQACGPSSVVQEAATAVLLRTRLEVAFIALRPRRK